MFVSLQSQCPSASNIYDFHIILTLTGVIFASFHDTEYKLNKYTDTYTPVYNIIITVILNVYK